MSEKPLYEDEQLMADYHPTSPEDHFLRIGGEGRKKIGYLIQHGILRELARTPRGEIESKIDAFNPEILAKIKEEGIKIDGLHVALCQAHIEEMERMKMAIRE